MKRNNVQPSHSPQRQYEAVIFDLDRTLIEHDQDSGALFDAACSAAGIEPFCQPETLELAAEVVREGSAELDAESYERRVFATAAAATGADVPVSELVQAYNDALDNRAVSLRPGADTAIESTVGLATAVVTNGPADTHSTKLQAVELTDCFDTVIYGTDVERVKPATDPFELALDRLQVEPRRVLKVGDSLSKDIKGANKLGIDTAWIPFGDRFRSLNEPEPTYTLSSLAEIPKILSS